MYSAFINSINLYPTAMYNIGILTKESVWEEKLSGFSRDSDFRISGSFSVASPELMESSEVFINSDVIWIPAPGPGYIDCAIQAVKLSRHVLFGFSVSEFPDMACSLVELANESRVQVQVGHHEHYNPAYRTMKQQINQVQFIDLHHHLGCCGDDYGHALFHSLLLDIDMIISLVPDSLKKKQSHFTHVCEDSPPIIHVRLEFHNGTVANLEINPFTTDRNTSMAVYQHQNILRVDMQKATATIESFSGPGSSGPGSQTRIWPLNGFPALKVEDDDPEFLTGECLSFIHNLRNKQSPVSSLEQGCEALKITRSIFCNIPIATT